MPELDTEDFKQWFEKSTVRNDAGEPLVVYHGTDAVFSDFQYGEFGFHFGSRETAETLGSILMEVHLLIKMRVKPRPSGRGRKARSDIENVAAMAD